MRKNGKFLIVVAVLAVLTAGGCATTYPPILLRHPQSGHEITCLYGEYYQPDNPITKVGRVAATITTLGLNRYMERSHQLICADAYKMTGYVCVSGCPE